MKVFSALRIEEKHQEENEEEEGPKMIWRPFNFSNS